MNAADVMTPDVVTVTPETTVPQLVKLLLSHAISGVPVVNAAGTIVGMVSEGDLLRRAELHTQKRRSTWLTFFTGTATLAEDYVRARGECANDIMTPTVISVAPNAPLADIADLMEERRIKRVPVVDGTRLIGIVSRSNLLRALASISPAAKPEITDDRAIHAALLAELANQPWSRRSDNTIVVSDGIVHLWGLVTTRDEQRAMELAATGVAGVKAVQSHMIVLSEEPYPLFPGGVVI